MKSATVIACNAHHSLIDIKSFPILHKSSLSVNDNCQGCCFFMAFTVLVIFKTFGCLFPIFESDRFVCRFFVFFCCQFWYILHAIKTKYTIFLNVIMQPWIGYQTSYVDRNKDFDIQFLETQNLSMDDKAFW